LGAPLLFALVWQRWGPAQRQALVAQARNSLEQSIAQMLCPAGSASAPEKDTQKLHLLLAACVPELFQEELSTEPKAMAALLTTVWGAGAVPGADGKLSKEQRQARKAAAAARPKHISAEMGFIDRMHWVWMQPTLGVIEHTLRALDYKVFDAPMGASASVAASLDPADNELYQRDLLLSLRAFWMSYFALQVFMALSSHFASTEEALLAQQRAAASDSEQPQPKPEQQQQPENGSEGAGVPHFLPAAAALRQGGQKKSPHDPTAPNGYHKPIHTFRLEDLGKQAQMQQSGASIEEVTDDAATAAAAVPNSSQCTGCQRAGTAADLKRCGRCKAAWYCSVDCQKRHFKVHKQVCKAPPPAAMPEATAPAVIADVPVD
jgi:hypothetical protein